MFAMNGRWISMDDSKILTNVSPMVAWNHLDSYESLSSIINVFSNAAYNMVIVKFF